MMKKRIGLVLNGPVTYSLTFIANEIKVWKNMGYDVVLFAKSTKGADPILSIKTYEGLPLKLTGIKSALRMAIGLMRLLVRGLGPSIRLIHDELNRGNALGNTLKKVYKVAHILPVHIDYLHFGFGNVAIHKENVARAMRVPMSVSFRGADVAIFPLGQSDIYTHLWKQVGKIHVISKDLQVLLSAYGLKEDHHVHLIYQTLDLAFFEKKEYSLREDKSPLKLLTVARLHWKKGLEYALLSIQQLVQDGIECHYTIIGSGEHEQAIRYAIKDLGLEHIVTLTGALKYQEVLDLMGQSDLYIQSSVQEGFALSVLEAQALGMLTIATNAEGISENIVDEHTGWIVPKRSVDALTLKIKEVFFLTQYEKEKIKKQAMKRVKDEFYLDRYQDEWRTFFS